MSEWSATLILHARSGVELSVTCRRNWARVDVADDNPRGPVRRRRQLDSGTGRGWF